jgi:hypothetical protein
MTDRPIIFSAPMVRALLDGRKTQTRRLLKVPGIMGGRYPILPPEEAIELEAGEFQRGTFHYASTGALSGPYQIGYATGDRLYVREAHYLTDDGDSEYAVYACDIEVVREHLANLAGLPKHFPPDVLARHQRLRPSIHMPRWASRLTLLVDDVRVERLQAISEADAIAEGAKEVPIGAPPGIPDLIGYHHGQVIEPLEDCFISASASFRHLWKSLHGPESWDANPFVVALTFSVVRGNIDRMEAAHG